MSKRPLSFRSVGRGLPCSLPSLWWKGPPGRALWLQHVACGQQQWSDVEPQLCCQCYGEFSPACTTTQRPSDNTHWFSAPPMWQIRPGGMELQGRSLGRRASSTHVQLSRNVVECGLPSCTVPTLTMPLPPHRTHGQSWKKNHSSLLCGMLLKQSRYTKDRPLSCAAVILFPPRHCHTSQVSA